MYCRVDRPWIFVKNILADFNCDCEQNIGPLHILLQYYIVLYCTACVLHSTVQYTYARIRNKIDFLPALSFEVDSLPPITHSSSVPDAV